MVDLQFKVLLPSFLHGGSLWLRQFGCQLTCIYLASSACSCFYFEGHSTSLPCRTLITPPLLTQAEARCVEVVKKPLATRADQRISARSACELLGGRRKRNHTFIEESGCFLRHLPEVAAAACQSPRALRAKTRVMLV